MDPSLVPQVSSRPDVDRPGLTRPGRLAISTSAFETIALGDALTRAAELGFQAVELVADLPHLFPSQWTVGQAARLAQQIESLGLAVVNLSAETGRGFYSPIPAGPIYEPSMIAPLPSGRRLRLQHLRRCLDFAFTLGVPVLTVATGSCLPGMVPAMAWELLLESLTVLLSHAEELGVLVAIAPRPGHLVARVDDFQAVQEALGHPLLGLNLDLAQMALQDEVFAVAIPAVAGRIWCVQATDAHRPRPYRLRPGLGDTPLAAMLGALRRSEYTGPLTLHLENYQDCPERAAREALDHLEALLASPALTP